MSSDIGSLNFLSEEQVRKIAVDGTPVFVYSRAEIKKSAEQALQFEAPFGLTVRYAMKANPHPEILQLLNKLGIQIDASSGYEAVAALASDIPANHIQVTTQELPENLQELIEKGVRFNACSLHQLEEYGKLAPDSKVGVRINPGSGAGLNNRLTTGGYAASFGIWHEYIPEIHKITRKYNLTVSLMHTHAGTGTDPDGWLAVAKRNFELLEQFPSATTTSLGGGFKVGRMPNEQTADLESISIPIAKLVDGFAQKTGREVRLEIEPGSFMVVNAGTLITKIIDKKDTGPRGYKFLVVNGGMTEILRPSLYGAQHPLVVVPRIASNSLTEAEEYAVSGHCCESGDMLTVAAGDPESLEPRKLREAVIGDFLCIEGAGAYCASMRASGYNSFPVAREVFVD